MITKFKLDLEGKTLSFEGENIELDTSLCGAEIDEVLILNYNKNVYEEEMDKINHRVQTTCPERSILIGGGEFDREYHVAIYGDIEAEIISS